MSVFRRPGPVRAAWLAAALLAGLGLTAAGRVETALPGSSDLDAFMEKVLARRDENWKKLQQYVLDEREQIDIRGPGRMPI